MEREYRDNQICICKIFRKFSPNGRVWANTVKISKMMIWRPFSRRGAKRRGLHDSVAPYLCPGQADVTLEDCFAAVLAGSDVSADNPESRSLNSLHLQPCSQGRRASANIQHQKTHEISDKNPQY
jgi:hypothetical protein